MLISMYILFIYLFLRETQHYPFFGKNSWNHMWKKNHVEIKPILFLLSVVTFSILCISHNLNEKENTWFISAYMHQKRREWEKKQKKFKNVANYNVPVLFASSEGLYLRLIDDDFGPSSVPNNEIDPNVSILAWPSLFTYPNT